MRNKWFYISALNLGIPALFGVMFAPFWKSFLTTFLILFIFFFIFNTIVKAIADYNLQKLANERIENIAKTGATVICPCSEQVSHNIPIDLRGDNTFKCRKCQKDVRVYIDMQTALLDEPDETQPKHPNILLEDVVEKLQKDREKENDE